MKNASLYLSIIALAAAAVLAVFMVKGNASDKNAEQDGIEAVAQKGAIVWFNMDTILSQYDMANDLRSVVETKVQGINQDVNKRGSRLEKDIAAFQEKIDKGLLTRSVAEVQGQKLQQRQAEFQQYAAKKQQEINEEMAVMQNQIADAIKTFIDEYNAGKEYAMIIATQGDILPAPVVAGDPDLDITSDLLDGLNAAYVKEKAKGSK
ncbi:MAG: OmpH family outer membrane protein [Bacteroidales bacterium]|nr:OmpH family outer membrane protein [Bacteroidales bacterium]